MKITFYGAAQSVTGSKHLIETNGLRILLDCGLHQGGHTAADQLNQTLPFDAASIDCVILSHAHADHSGMLPILVKQGFRGKIYCTAATAEIAKFILLDSAMVQAQDLKYASRHIGPGMKPPAVMYTKEEAEEVFQYFEPVPYFRLDPQWVKLSDTVRFKFYDAGHILGSAVTYLETKERGVVRGLVYTGDLGPGGVPLLHDPEPVAEPATAVISEATYGAGQHAPISEARAKLADAVRFAVAHKSKIIVPAFALGRTQELIYLLHDLTDQGVIPRIPIYVDGPLTLNITEVFMHHREDFNSETWQDFAGTKERPLIFGNLDYVETVEESKALNTQPGPFMIISSSGMMEGGRILHHLKNNIEDPNTTVLITGYQAEHTLGRALQEGADSVRIYGSSLSVRARIITLNELSAHADQKFLAAYLKRIAGLAQVFLVHTELPQAEALKQILQSSPSNFQVTIPSLGQSFEVK
jgi:metallo-beta-lactamase family protein